MIADTNFVSEILKERARGRRGPAMDFLATHRKEPLCTCIITVGELAPWFGRSAEIWPALRRWPIFRLHDGIVNAAADLDRQLKIGRASCRERV